jgi:hypothetical protein
VNGLAVDDHNVFCVACPGVELQPFADWPIGFSAREGDERAIGISLAGNPTFREMHCDVAPDILPAADGLVRLRDSHCKRGGGGNGGEGGAAPEPPFDDPLFLDVVWSSIWTRYECHCTLV